MIGNLAADRQTVNRALVLTLYSLLLISVAVQLASKVAIPGFLQYATFDTEMSFQELTIDKWAGKTLRELNLPSKKEIMVISIRGRDEDHFSFIPNAEYILKQGDRLIVMRRTNDIAEIKS